MKKVLTVLALIAFSTSVMAATSKIESFVNKAISPVTTAEKNLNTKVENQKKADAARKAELEKKQKEQQKQIEAAKKDLEKTKSDTKKAVENEKSFWKNLFSFKK